MPYGVFGAERVKFQLVQNTIHSKDFPENLVGEQNPSIMLNSVKVILGWRTFSFLGNHQFKN